jgi:hypothetical protein
MKPCISPQNTALLLVIAILFLCACRKSTIEPSLDDNMPKKIVWAWERPEDLKFLDPAQFGVAFLAQSVLLEKERVIPKPRRQSLDVLPGTYLIAVTRIETNKETAKRPTFEPEMANRTAALITSTLDLPNVRAVQVDFDAVTSERAFYRELMTEIKERLPPGTPLTMTSLASWCTGDAWFNDFPVDEAVPMVFQMGANDEQIKMFLRNGNDWNEPLCRGSYGLSVNEPLNISLKPGRRTYYFNDSSWKRSDLGLLR